MKLTPFLAQEMLFEYATGRLDPVRSEAVRSFLETDAQSRRVLADIERSLAFCAPLKALRAKEEFLESLKNEDSLRIAVSKAFQPHSWPDSLRWSAVAILISLVSAVFFVSVPWDQIEPLRRLRLPKSDLVEIAAIPKLGALAGEGSVATDVTSQSELDADTNSVEEGSGDEEYGDGLPQISSAESARQNQPEQSMPRSLSRTQPAPADPKEQSSSAKAKGFVYRASMALPQPDEINPSLVLQLRELGAERAGEVELGWKRGSGRYYHFSLPETNEARLLEILNSYGPVRISKDPHPRVMPQGQLRFILWIEAGS